MNNCKIGIKLADGSFYPILEEGGPQSKIIELTTVRDDQTTVQLDLYRSSSDDMEDAEYVDTLLVENLLPRPKETPTLNLKIEIDAENVLSASIEDCESGESSETKVSLVNLDSSDRTIVPDFSMIDAETADNEEVDSLLDEFADNTIAVSGETTMENELDNNEDLNLDDLKKSEHKYVRKGVQDSAISELIFQLLYKCNNYLKAEKYFPSSKIISSLSITKPDSLRKLRTSSISDCGCSTNCCI